MQHCVLMVKKAISSLALVSRAFKNWEKKDPNLDGDIVFWPDRSPLVCIYVCLWRRWGGNPPLYRNNALLVDLCLLFEECFSLKLKMQPYFRLFFKKVCRYPATCKDVWMCKDFFFSTYEWSVQASFISKPEGLSWTCSMRRHSSAPSSCFSPSTLAVLQLNMKCIWLKVPKKTIFYLTEVLKVLKNVSTHHFTAEVVSVL